MRSRKTDVKDRSMQSAPSLRAHSRRPNAPEAITVRVHLKLHQRGGRKLVVTPTGIQASVPIRQHVENTLVKAIARAHRWKQMMESGNYTSIAELAATEKINDSYLCRMLRLTLLAPEIVEAVLQGRERGLQLRELMKPFPVEWKSQHDLSPLLRAKRTRCAHHEPFRS